MAEHAELFGRAALVARDQQGFDKVQELSEDERGALAYERDHKWHGPKLVVTIPSTIISNMLLLGCSGTRSHCVL